MIDTFGMTLYGLSSKIQRTVDVTKRHKAVGEKESMSRYETGLLQGLIETLLCDR